MKSKAQEAADLYYAEVTRKLWVEHAVTRNKDAFLAGVMYAVEQAEQILIEMANAKLEVMGAVIINNKLKQLLEQAK